MNDGAIEQEGPPEEVYNEPATVFAAGYMARSNRLPGTLIENVGEPESPAICAPLRVVTANEGGFSSNETAGTSRGGKRTGSPCI